LVIVAQARGRGDLHSQLVYEYKLKVTPAKQAAIDEAIRVVQFIRNTCLRWWMDERGINANDLPTACSRLAQAFAFVAPSTCKPARPLPTAPGPQVAASTPTARRSARATRATRASRTTAARSNTRSPVGSSTPTAST